MGPRLAWRDIVGRAGRRYDRLSPHFLGVMVLEREVLSGKIDEVCRNLNLRDGDYLFPRLGRAMMNQIALGRSEKASVALSRYAIWADTAASRLEQAIDGFDRRDFGAAVLNIANVALSLRTFVAAQEKILETTIGEEPRLLGLDLWGTAHIQELPVELRPQEAELLPLPSGRVVPVLKTMPCFRRWSGLAPIPLSSTYATKPLADVDGTPCFPELAILKLLKAFGWNGL